MAFKDSLAKYIPRMGMEYARARPMPLWYWGVSSIIPFLCVLYYILTCWHVGWKPIWFTVINISHVSCAMAAAFMVPLFDPEQGYDRLLVAKRLFLCTALDAIILWMEPYGTVGTLLIEYAVVFASFGYCIPLVVYPGDPTTKRVETYRSVTYWYRLLRTIFAYSLSCMNVYADVAVGIGLIRNKEPLGYLIMCLLPFDVTHAVLVNNHFFKNKLTKRSVEFGLSLASEVPIFIVTLLHGEKFNTVVQRISLAFTALSLLTKLIAILMAYMNFSISSYVKKWAGTKIQHKNNPLAVLGSQWALKTQNVEQVGFGTEATVIELGPPEVAAATCPVITDPVESLVTTV